MSLQFYSKVLEIGHHLGNFMIAIIVAFHTDLVPQIVYFFESGYSMEGFVNTTQSFYDANLIREAMKADSCVSKISDTTFPYCM